MASEIATKVAQGIVDIARRDNMQVPHRDTLAIIIDAAITEAVKGERDAVLLGAEHRDLIARLRSSLSTYAAQAHSYSGYHVGGKANFLTCEVATCVRARKLIADAVDVLERGGQPSTSGVLANPERGKSLVPETNSESSSAVDD